MEGGLSVRSRDVDRFGERPAGDSVEHEETPSLVPTNEGVTDFFRMYIAAFPNLRMDAEDVLASGDKAIAGGGSPGPEGGRWG